MSEMEGSSLRNCKGFMYAELLSACFIISFVIFSVLPLFKDIQALRKETLTRIDAHHLLYDKLAAYMEGEIEGVESSLFYGGQEYVLFWKEKPGYAGIMEGCIRYEKMDKEIIVFCDDAKR